VMDRTIIEQINMGNADVAVRLRQLYTGGGQLWMTRETYNQFRTEADHRLFLDLNILSPIQDNYVDRFYDARMLDNMPMGTVETAALALYMKGEVMTTNRLFNDAFLPYGVVPGMRAFASVKGGVDYNRARILLQL